MEVARDVLKRSIQSLLKLQEIDGRLFQLKSAEATPHLDYTQAQEKSAVLQREFKTADRLFRDIDRERRSLELKTLTLGEDLKRAEGKRRDLRNTKEEFAANKEVENFQKRIAETRKLLDEKSEVTKKRTEERETKLKDSEAQEAFFKELDTKRQEEVKSIALQRDELMTQRDQYISLVDEQIFALYERVQKLRKGNGVALVKGTVCSGCHVIIPPQTRRILEQMNALITCSSCSRILYPESELDSPVNTDAQNSQAKVDTASQTRSSLAS